MINYNKEPKKLTKLILLIFIVLIHLLNCEKKPSVPPHIASKISFNDIFELFNTIEISGNATTPIFTTYNLYLKNNRIFIPDYIGNSVNIYNSNGDLIIKLGGEKGSKPGFFNMPYTVVQDKEGFIYINDRGNRRIQIYDSRFNFVKLINLNTTVESILNSQNSKIILVAVAPTFQFKGGKKYLMREITNEGSILDSFGVFNKDYISYSWAACVDNDNNIYICNIYDNIINIYKQNRKLLRRIKIESPSFIPLNSHIKAKPKTLEEYSEKQRAFHTIPHSMISRIFVYNNNFFVLHRLKNNPNKMEKYLLDIFDEFGNLLFYSIDIPGEITCQNADKFYYVEHNKNMKYGHVKIIGIKILVNKFTK